MGKMTIRQCMDAVFQLLNQYSIAGSKVPLSYNDQKDTENRMLNLINDAQMEIATTVRPIHESLRIVNEYTPNLLPNDRYCLSMHRKVDEAITLGPTKKPATAAYFEVDGDAVVTVGTNVVYCTGSGFQEYRVLINGQADKITFGGTGSYNFRNVAMYNGEFASADDIPQYGSYRRFEMPEDFNYSISVKYTPAFGGHTKDSAFVKWEDRTHILLPLAAPGEYFIDYCRFPVRYESDVNTDTELDNLPDTHNAIPYFVASMIAIDDHPAAYAALYNVWETKLARLGYKPATTQTTLVEDVYGFDRMWGW